MNPAFRRSFLTRRQLFATELPSRPFVSTAHRSGQDRLSTDSSVKTDKYPDDQHITKKPDDLNVQSHASSGGRNARAEDTGGQAATESDSRSNTARAKEEHPEAPDVVIGMQDERGGKGH